jgi:predicted ArsR family transcriptional regulator
VVSEGVVPEDQGADRFAERVRSIALLAEPARLALYRFVAVQPEPVSREQAAVGVGVPRHVAKFHLDRLVEDGLLDFEYRRPPDRRGPGAGRPSKVYRRSARDLDVSVPQRRYELAGRILAEAVTRAEQEDRPVATTLREAARAAGVALAEKVRAAAGPSPTPADLRRVLLRELRDVGFEPRPDPGGLEMANCPFHALAQEYPQLICGMNLDFFRAMLEHVDAAGIVAELGSGPGGCCVSLRGPLLVAEPGAGTGERP